MATDSIITDSANAMSAYTTGHKSSVNALGVYVSRAKDNLAHPKVETITELVRRKTGMAVGIVTDAEVEDATPAGMVAHTRRRETGQFSFARCEVNIATCLTKDCQHGGPPLPAALTGRCQSVDHR